EALFGQPVLYLACSLLRCPVQLGSLIDRVASLDRKVRECMRQMSAHPGDVGQHPSELLVLLQIDASSAQIDDVLEQRLYQPRAQAGLELRCKKPHDSAFERTAVVEP